MKFNTRSFARWAMVAIVSIAIPTNSTYAQNAGYQTPRFAHMGMGVNEGAGKLPPFPASPLAGGATAARGGQFMDASGNPIVIPASYCQGCGPAEGGYGGGGYCETCPGGMGEGGYGDPMAVNFGGYGEDQCGPHYFDVFFETVFLQQDDLVGEGLPALGSIGVGNAPGQTNNPVLNVANSGDELDPGFRIAARVDLGALSVLEAEYTGLYDLGFEQSVNQDPALPDQLFSIFSNYGFIDQDGGDGIQGIPGLDEASQYTLKYESDLQSTEFNYRRYWLGDNTRISGTYLVGFRYTRMTEDLIFSAITPSANGVLGTFTQNDLVGFQFGGDGWICLRQGLRVGASAKGGVYNNRYKFDTSIANINANVINPQPDAEGNQIAFIGESRVSFVADILPSWSLKGGYEFLYLNSVVTAQGNVNTDIFNDLVNGAPALGTQGHVFYHGFHAGMEYIW